MGFNSAFEVLTNLAHTMLVYMCDVYPPAIRNQWSLYSETLEDWPFIALCGKHWISQASLLSATDYGLDGLGIESPWGRDFPHLPRPALRPIQPPVTMGTGSFLGVNSGRSVTLTPHPLLVLLVMKEYSYTSTPPMGRTVGRIAQSV